MRGIFAAAAIACMATASQAATIVNGSFENGAFSGAGFDTLGAGNTSITGWTIGGAGVDWIGSHWTAADGNRSLDLSALSGGIVSQVVATEAGQRYKVSFGMAGNPDGTPTDKVINVSVDGDQGAGFNFSTVGKSRSNMGWVNYDYYFTAGTASSTLSFFSPINTPSGPALDNVSISAVPEASTWALLIVGFGMVGVTARRRRTSVAA